MPMASLTGSIASVPLNRCNDTKEVHLSHQLLRALAQINEAADAEVTQQLARDEIDLDLARLTETQTRLRALIAEKEATAPAGSGVSAAQEAARAWKTSHMASGRSIWSRVQNRTSMNSGL